MTGGADGAHVEEPQLSPQSHAYRLRKSRLSRPSRQPQLSLQAGAQLVLHVVVQPQEWKRFRIVQRKPHRSSPQALLQAGGQAGAHGAWQAGACSHTVTGTIRGRLTQTSWHTWYGTRR